MNISAKTGRTVKAEDVAANKDTTVTITKKQLHPLTKIFDLVRRGKNEQALRLIKKFSEDDRAELDRIVRSLETKLIIAD